MADRFQFGLGAMFAAITLVAVVVALIVAIGEVGLVLSILLLAIVFGVVGVIRHSMPMVLAAALFVPFVALPLLLFTIGSAAAWIGHRDVPLRFVVLDVATRRPIAGAHVEICGGESPRDVLAGSRAAAQGDSAADGAVVIHHTFWASGRDSWWRHSGSVYSMERWVKISATGYQIRVLFLDDLIGQRRDLEAPPPPVIEVLMDVTEFVEDEPPQSANASGESARE